MRTIVIWDECGSVPIQFFVVPGDYRHLDRTYINSMDCDEAKQDELNELIYLDDEGAYRHPGLEQFPTLEPGDVVIVAGFMP